MFNQRCWFLCDWAAHHKGNTGVGPTEPIALFLDGKQLISADGSGTIQVWGARKLDVSSAAKIFELALEWSIFERAPKDSLPAPASRARRALAHKPGAIWHSPAAFFCEPSFVMKPSAQTRGSASSKRSQSPPQVVLKASQLRLATTPLLALFELLAGMFLVACLLWL